MRVSDAGLRFIAGHEGKRNSPYNDPSGYATIGVGHLIGRRPVTQADRDQWGTLTDDQVFALFREDIKRFADPVSAAVKVPVTQNQFDALVSFSFNVGVGAFQKSTLLRLLNVGNYAGAANEFAKWNKSGGKVLAGLTRRRAEEAAMFRRLDPGGAATIEVPKSTPSPQSAPRVELQRGPSSKFGKAEWMHPVFRVRLESLHDAVPFTVTSGGRSTKRQRELYNLFLAGKGNPANKPGSSWHEYDPESNDPWTLCQAADIEPKVGHTDAQLHRASKQFGLHFPIRGEPWHIQPAEAASSKRQRGQGLTDIPRIKQEEDVSIKRIIRTQTQDGSQVISDVFEEIDFAFVKWIPNGPVWDEVKKYAVAGVDEPVVVLRGEFEALQKVGSGPWPTD